MKRRVSGWQRVVSQLVFILYLGILFYFLFFSERYGRTDISDEYHYNLVLFREIKRFYRYREILGMKSVMINLAGNVVAFMPFGFFLPILWQKSGKLLYVTFWSFSFSLVVETIQLVYKVVTFDVDDLFLNTLGGIFGYMMMRLLFVGVRVGRH
ncbi:MAG: VanZ family protein, partial [Lachnospiraceae bacterium]|nr:VanZ family protein [Lachnospiraceae bacterium]